jgi:hypothetical protein
LRTCPAGLTASNQAGALATPIKPNTLKLHQLLVALADPKFQAPNLKQKSKIEMTIQKGNCLTFALSFCIFIFTVCILQGFVWGLDFAI